METKKVVGMRIKSLRRARGYSQERLAEIIGINPKYLSSIERGEENPTLDLLMRLSQGLKVEMQEIFKVGITTAATDVVLANLISSGKVPDFGHLYLTLSESS